MKLPPLDQRRDEIPGWARFMLARRHGGSAGAVALSPAAEAELAAHDWPGNLRQLDNVTRRAYTLALMDAAAAGAVPAAITVSREHVARALAYESGDRPASLLDLLDAAAAAFIAESRRSAAGGAALDLDLADTFRGFVLAAAAASAGSRESAMALVFRESLLAGRNHHKLLRRELARVETLCRALGVPVPAVFAALGSES